MPSVIQYTKAFIDNLVGTPADWSAQLNSGLSAPAGIGAASSSTPGVVQLATSADAAAGTNASRVVTPAALAGHTSHFVSTSRTSGPFWAFCGDSIVNGTGATNVIYSLRYIAPQVAGGQTIAAGPINGGVAGDNSGQLLARMPAILAQNPKAVFVMVGTNDAASAIPIATYQANMIAIKALVDAYAIPMMVGLVTPRSSAFSATILSYISAQNLWLRSWTAAQGIALVDTYTPLVDPTTGYIASAMDSGDGVHPSNAGHLALSVAIAAGAATVVRTPAWPVVSKNNGGLTTEPLNSNNTATANGWNHIAGPYPDTWAIDAPIAGDGVGAGRWLRVQTTNSTASFTYSGISKSVPSSGWSAGDKLAFFVRIEADKTTSLNKVQILDQNNASLYLAMDGAPVIKPGPLVFTYTVPSTGTPTAINLNVYLGGAPNTTSFVRIGATDVFNLTRLGVDLGI